MLIAINCCCLTLSKPFLCQWSSVERPGKNVISWHLIFTSLNRLRNLTDFRRKVISDHFQYLAEVYGASRSGLSFVTTHGASITRCLAISLVVLFAQFYFYPSSMAYCCGYARIYTSYIRSCLYQRRVNWMLTKILPGDLKDLDRLLRSAPWPRPTFFAVACH